MMGGTPPYATITPLMLPNTAPSAMPRGRASTAGILGNPTTMNETIMATRPIVEPTDKSIPRVIMTIIWASATITSTEMSSRMFWKLSTVRKAGLRRLTNPDRTRMKTMMPTSRNLTTACMSRRCRRPAPGASVSVTTIVPSGELRVTNYELRITNYARLIRNS